MSGSEIDAWSEQRAASDSIWKDSSQDCLAGVFSHKHAEDFVAVQTQLKDVRPGFRRRSDVVEGTYVTQALEAIPRNGRNIPISMCMALQDALAT